MRWDNNKRVSYLATYLLVAKYIQYRYHKALYRIHRDKQGVDGEHYLRPHVSIYQIYEKDEDVRHSQQDDEEKRGFR